MNASPVIYFLRRLSNEVQSSFTPEFPEIFRAADKAYFSWETGFIKPNKEAYLFILREWKLKPEEVVYFDDSAENVAVAESLGIRAEQWKGIAKAKESIGALLR